MDAVVLIGGCDKTLPAQLMAAASANRPAIVLPVGPMLVGHFKGEALGCLHRLPPPVGPVSRRHILRGRHREGERAAGAHQGHLHGDGHRQHHGLHRRDAGHGPARQRIDPGDPSDRLRVAEATGRLAAEMAKKQGPRPSEIMTAAAFRNALTVLQAIGGSTNALVHLTAVARRLGVDIELEEFDQIGRKVPVLVDLKPSGDHYMEHFHWAGGNSRLMREIRTHLDEKCLTVSGRTLKQVIDAAEIVPNQTVIRTPKNPIKPTGGMAVLRGNLAPRGAVIKHAAASPALMTAYRPRRRVRFARGSGGARRRSRARRDGRRILVLRNAGPKGAPGMPEAGSFPIPMKLARPA